MQVVILCGGKGTRLNELTEEIPKPMIEIGRKPILWHLMMFYKHYGHQEFILCLGYKGEKIKKYFQNSKFDIKFVDTGLYSNKGSRLLKIRQYINQSRFLVSYGDDLSDIDVNEVIKYHELRKKCVTLTAIQLTSPFGILELNDSDEVIGFKEKPVLDYIMNGGFYVFDKTIFKFIKEGYDLEKETFNDLAHMNQISAFKHKGFWKSMNTLKDVIELNQLWKTTKPWVVWE